MSRCFPYPPPGYTLSRAKKEALIESIKEKEWKEKKREMKERNVRKERNAQKDKTYPSSDKSDAVKDHIRHKVLSDSREEISLKRMRISLGSRDKILLKRINGSKDVGSESRGVISMKRRHLSQKEVGLESRDETSLKKRKAESEQFEHSSLTEEHGQPDRLPVPSSSYDSTENSKRHFSAIDRKRPLAIDNSQSHGKTILIRLPSKMQSAIHSLASGQQLSSISSQSLFPSQHKDDSCLRDGHNTCNAEQREGTCSVSGQNIEAVFGGKAGSRSKSKAIGKSIRRAALQYEDLVENWSPPELQDVSLYSDDLDWLFPDWTRNQNELAERRPRSGSESIRSSGVWDRAEYLAEIDTYALPYVVPC